MTGGPGGEMYKSMSAGNCVGLLLRGVNGRGLSYYGCVEVVHER